VTRSAPSCDATTTRARPSSSRVRSENAVSSRVVPILVALVKSYGEPATGSSVVGSPRSSLDQRRVAGIVSTASSIGPPSVTYGWNPTPNGAGPSLTFTAVRVAVNPPSFSS
jgi:hypothetical protein